MAAWTIGVTIDLYQRRRMSGKHKAIIGACGEHYVAALLSGLGLIVALPRGGVSTTDLLVTDPDCESAVAIQVKTSRNPLQDGHKARAEQYLAWHTSANVIGRVSPSLWYAYVALNEWPTAQHSPDVYFVPSEEVSRVVREEQRTSSSSMLFYWLGVEQSEAYLGTRGAQAILDQLKRGARGLARA